MIIFLVIRFIVWDFVGLRLVDGEDDDRVVVIGIIEIN